MTLTRKLIVAIFVLATSQPVFAVNRGYLNESTPLFYYTDEDFDILMSTIQKALNEKPDGEKLVWKNDKTGHTGLVNPLNTFNEKGVTCRNTRLINRANNKIAEIHFKFCKQPDGEWKIAP